MRNSIRSARLLLGPRSESILSMWLGGWRLCYPMSRPGSALSLAPCTAYRWRHKPTSDGIWPLYQRSSNDPLAYRPHARDRPAHAAPGRSGRTDFDFEAIESDLNSIVDHIAGTADAQGLGEDTIDLDFLGCRHATYLNLRDLLRR